MEMFVPSVLAPTALYFTDERPEGSVCPERRTWTCIFAYMAKVQRGETACFSADAPGCAGAVNYFGFGTLPTIAAALFLAGKEHLKRDASLAAAFYNNVNPLPASGRYLVFRRLDCLEEGIEPIVINLWVDADSLARLHTLANYDRPTNDNVIMPFSSGCQSIWTLPLQESMRNEPRAVAGSLYPTVRRFLPHEAISFSVPSMRFLELCANIDGSFLNP
jgi:hypothetical protein